MRRKRSEGRRHFPAVKLVAHRIEFGIRIDLTADLKAIRPAVMLAVLDYVKRIRGSIVTQMIRAHVGNVEFAAGPAKTDRVAQAAREVVLVFAIGVHLQNAGSNFFLLLACVATASDRDVDFSIAAHDHSAREMPATIFVAETVVGKSRQHLRLAGRRVLARLVTITNETISECEIEPACSVSIGVEGDAVWIV